MKYIIVILSILILTSSCSPCLSAQAHKDAVIKEAQTYINRVHLPTIFSDRLGNSMVFDKPQVTFISFDRKIPNMPYFESTIYYYNPCFSPWDRFWINWAHAFVNIPTEDGYMNLYKISGVDRWGYADGSNIISLSELSIGDNLSWR